MHPLAAVALKFFTSIDRHIPAGRAAFSPIEQALDGMATGRPQKNRRRDFDDQSLLAVHSFKQSESFYVFTQHIQ